MTRNYRDSHTVPGKAGSYDRAFFDNAYRSVIWQLEQEVLNRIVDQHLVESGGRHLDFACGTARIVRALHKRVGRSVGVDISEEMLSVARERVPGVDFAHGDITQEDVLGDQKFDFITAFRFFPNAEEALRTSAAASLASLLDRDGVLVFNNHKNRGSLVHILSRLIGRGRGRRMGQNEVRELISKAGLEIVEIYHIGVVPCSENFCFLPKAALKVVERVLGRFGFMRGLAQNQIFVCRHRAEAG